MKVLGGGLSQPIRERLEHDARVVIVGTLEAGDVLLDADAGGHGERADMVGNAARLGGHIVGQAFVRLALGLALLLAQERQCRQDARTLLVGIHLHVIADRVRRKQSDDGARLQPVLRNQLLQHPARVGVQIARGLPHDGIGQHLRKLAGELPGVEERHPVDVPEQLAQGVVIEAMDARGARRCRREHRPLDAAPIRTRLRQANLGQLEFLAGVLLAPPRVILTHLRQERSASVRPRERLADTDRARRILHVDDTRCVLRSDFH